MFVYDPIEITSYFTIECIIPVITNSHGHYCSAQCSRSISTWNAMLPWPFRVKLMSDFEKTNGGSFQVEFKVYN